MPSFKRSSQRKSKVSDMKLEVVVTLVNSGFELFVFYLA
jgi:hypothetical protein